MKSPLIRPFVLLDIDELQTVARKTFVETYQGKREDCPVELLYEYVEKTFNKTSFQKDIDSDDVETWVAELNNQMIGYFKITKEVPPSFVKEQDFFQLERLYLLKKFQKKGIGKILLKKSELIALQQGSKGLWISVWDENKEAIEFYKKTGFKKVGSHKWEFDYSGFHYVDIDDVMIKNFE